MIGLLQRVSHAQVTVANETIGRIERGILVFVGVERGDDENSVARLLKRLLEYRVFPDAQDRMNLSVLDIAGHVMLVPQFTLAADTNKGTRAGFQTAAPPVEAQHLFEHIVALARNGSLRVESGRFGADMHVALVNDGPVTFLLKSGVTGRAGTVAAQQTG